MRVSFVYGSNYATGKPKGGLKLAKRDARFRYTPAAGPVLLILGKAKKGSARTERSHKIQFCSLRSEHAADSTRRARSHPHTGGFLAGGRIGSNTDTPAPTALPE